MHHPLLMILAVGVSIVIAPPAESGQDDTRLTGGLLVADLDMKPSARLKAQKHKVNQFFGREKQDPNKLRRLRDKGAGDCNVDIGNVVVSAKSRAKEVNVHVNLAEGVFINCG